MDSNSFITPKNIYYPFDIFPSYWNTLSELSGNKKLYLITQVEDELLDGHEEDFVRKWIENEFQGETIKTYDEDIVEEWQNILNFIQSSRLYNDSAFNSWADATVADPWILATAKVYGYTVVSLEERNRNLGIGNATKSIKLPDVCDVFHVPYMNLQDMLRTLKVSI